MLSYVDNTYVCVMSAMRSFSKMIVENRLYFLHFHLLTLTNGFLRN